MKYQYVPGDAPSQRNARLAHLGCELTEAGHAIFKIQRWGGHSAHPQAESYNGQPINNVGELLLELWDVEFTARAILPDIVRFLGEDRVRELRTFWESRALPPPGSIPDGDAPPDAPPLEPTSQEAHDQRVQLAAELNPLNEYQLRRNILSLVPQFVFTEDVTHAQLVAILIQLRQARDAIAREEVLTLNVPIPGEKILQRAMDHSIQIAQYVRCPVCEGEGGSKTYKGHGDYDEEPCSACDGSGRRKGT